MLTSSNTILITGGGSGIGYALAERFLRTGNEVIICGRRAEMLQEAKRMHPSIHIRICDLSTDRGRADLFHWASKEFPDLDVLVNNAGIQHRTKLTEPDQWKAGREEIAINFEAPVHLSMLFAPFLMKQREATIINITSGLAFAPLASVPVYCATKAALRSFTLSLRRQLAGTSVSVIEIMPPAVQTDLGGPGLHDSGVPLAEFADHVMSELREGAIEISYGFSEKSSHASREELNEMFTRMNPI